MKKKPLKAVSFFVTFLVVTGKGIGYNKYYKKHGTKVAPLVIV